MVVGNKISNSTDRTRIFLVDDHDLVVRGLCDILRREPDMEVVGSATDSDHLIEKVRMSKAEVVLLDVRMAKFDVFEAVAALHDLCRTSPNGRAPGIIFVTAVADPYTATQAQKLGVRGYLLKEEALSQSLPGAIRLVANGGSAYSGEVQKMLYNPRSMPEGPTLGGEQYNVLALRVAGYTSEQIAKQLGKTMHSIYTIQYRIRTKLEVENNSQAVSKSILQIIVTLNL